MSDQITTTGTGSNATFNVYYGVENRQKRIEWVSGTCTVRKLYSALQDLFDELTQMDDGVPMSAQTPTEFTIGIIDAGDSDPWFIDRTTVEYLYGGALSTASWTRDLPGDGTGNIGIVRIGYSWTSNNFTSTDIGKTITNQTGGDSGTLLDYKTTTGSNGVAWIRPASSALANDWDSTSGNLLISGSTLDTAQTSAGVTGESLWSNIYTLGTIEAETHIYVYQNGSYLTAYKSADSSDWWDENNEPNDNEHIDVLINVKECDVEPDDGYVTVLARQYSKTYSYYIVDLQNGGRNPIPLQTGDDLDNETGYRQFTATGIGGTGDAELNAGNYIYYDTGSDTWDTTTKKGVITDVSTDDEVTYYLIGEPISDFANSDSLNEYDGTADTGDTATAGAPSDVGPAALGTPPTALHGETATGLVGNDGGSGTDYDVDEDGTEENYSIVIDCNQNPLTDVYEWCKYITRRGMTTPDTATDGINGEYYIGSDYRLIGSESGELTEGETVTGGTSGATGIVVYHNTEDNIVILRNSRGTFTAETVTGGTSGQTITVASSANASAITPIAAAPFGTFAGGKFFCAPGVVLIDYQTSDLNNFQLVDDNGTVRVAPTKVNITVNNTRSDDRVAVFRLTASGGDIEKTYYTCVGGESATGTTLVVNQTIRTDEPGKTSGGVLRLVDDSADVEYRIRFASWSTSTFTLASATLSPEVGTNTTTVVDTGAFTTALCKVGDLIYNSTQGAASYVTVRDSDDQVTISPAIASQTSTDSIYKNVLPIAPEATNDTVYVPFIDAYETTGTQGTPGSETVQIVYDTTVFTRVRARQAGDILPFEQDSSIGSNGMTVSVIRTTDTIYA
jgi:hypothetical protein